MMQQDSTLQDVIIGGQRVAYRMAGDPQNPPVIFVHGWLLHSGIWRHMAAALAEKYYCIALDLPGFADSDKPYNGAAYSIASQAQTVLKLADALGLNRFALVGHSMGGQIVLHIASHAPQRVTRLIAIAPVVSGKLGFVPKWITIPQMWIGKMLPPAVPPTVWLFRQPTLARAMFSVWFNRMPPMEQWHEDMIHATEADIVPAAYWAGKAIISTDLSDDLAQISAPTLIIFGRKDRVVPPSEGVLAGKNIAGSQVEWLETCGHFPLLEETTRTNALVAAFLNLQHEPVNNGAISQFA